MLLDSFDLQANSWCARGIELLASQRIEKCSISPEHAEESLQEIQQFVLSASEFCITSSPSELREVFKESATQETKALVSQVSVCLCVESTFLHHHQIVMILCSISSKIFGLDSFRLDFDRFHVLPHIGCSYDKMWITQGITRGILITRKLKNHINLARISQKCSDNILKTIISWIRVKHIQAVVFRKNLIS